MERGVPGSVLAACAPHKGLCVGLKARTLLPGRPWVLGTGWASRLHPARGLPSRRDRVRPELGHSAGGSGEAEDGWIQALSSGTSGGSVLKAGQLGPRNVGFVGWLWAARGSPERVEDGDRSQGVAQAPEWVDESQPRGRRKKGGGERGETESPSGRALPKASAHLTDGETEALEAAESCPRLTVQTGWPKGEELAGQEVGRRPLAPHYSLTGSAQSRQGGASDSGLVPPSYSLQGLSHVLGVHMAGRGSSCRVMALPHQGTPMAPMVLARSPGLGLTPSC